MNEPTNEQPQEIKRGPGRPPSAKPAEPEKLDWVTPEEAGEYESMLFKPYVRKEELKAGEAKKFFYEITSMSPYVPAGIVSQQHQHLVSFLVQKFHRNEFITRKEFAEGRRAPKETKSNAEVKWVSIDPATGNPHVLDSDATFQIDSRQFEKLFVRDEK